MHWKLTVAFLCIFGVLRKFRPVTPFLTPYLVAAEYKNFTNQQVYGEVYTYAIYANLISMIPIFFCIDLVRYKPILVLEAVFLFGTWILLAYGTSIVHMQLMQICYGISLSADVSYYSYLFAVVKKKHYKRVTSYIQSASMVGKFLAYSLGQFLISTDIGDYLLLNQLTLAVSMLNIPIALCLPMATSKRKRLIAATVEENAGGNNATKPQTLLLHDNDDTAAVLEVEVVENGRKQHQEQQQQDLVANVNEQSVLLLKTVDADNGISANASDNVKMPEQKSQNDKCMDDNEKEISAAGITATAIPRHFAKIKKNLFNHFKSPIVLRWFLWTVLFQCGIYQTQNFVQTLWAVRQAGKRQIWNGIVDSVNTLLAALLVFLLQFIPLRWEQYDLLVFVTSSSAFALLLYAMVHFVNIYVDYALYIVFYGLFNMLSTIAMNLIASNLNSGSYGFVFGLSSFLTLLSDGALAFLFVDRNGLFHLGIEQQFLVYSYFFLSTVIAVVIFTKLPTIFRRLLKQTCHQTVNF